MGAAIGLGRGDDDEEEAAEAEALGRWRPEHIVTSHVVKRKVEKDDGSGDGSSTGSEAESVASSVSRMDDDDGEEKPDADDVGKSERGDDDEGDGSSSEDEEDEENDHAKSDDRRKKRIVVRMEFEPLLSLHEPLATVLEEPVDLFASNKKAVKNQRAEQAAIQDGQALCRSQAKAVALWMLEVGLEDCLIGELAQTLGEVPDELRYQLEQSHRFTVDDDGVVRRTLVQRILDVMQSDIETMQELMEKLGPEVEEGDMRYAVKQSLGELVIKNANGIDLIERVDPEEDQRARSETEKKQRAKEKEDKKKELIKRQRKKGASMGDDDLSSSSSGEENEEGPGSIADKKALAFRRVQVQRKIEDFLKAYTKGVNLIKINAKGKRYSRRVYVDTHRRALVVQGASGPKFFPFASMKEVDLETRTTKEGRVETLVICAIEKGGRIVKELTLAFPDQAKANAFVNCVTLFSLALRKSAKS